jgi:hypothetical protein
MFSSIGPSESKIERIDEGPSIYDESDSLLVWILARFEFGRSGEKLSVLSEVCRQASDSHDELEKVYVEIGRDRRLEGEGRALPTQTSNIALVRVRTRWIPSLYTM